MERFNGWHVRLESRFGEWSLFVTRHRIPAVLFLSAATIFLGVQLPEIKVDNSEQAFLHADDPVRRSYDAFLDQFGDDGLGIIGIRAPRIFDLAFLKKLRAMHREVEARVPYVTKVTSLLNVRHVYGDGDKLVVEDLLEEWPQNRADLDAIETAVRTTPHYQLWIIDEDFELATITLTPVAYSTLPPEVDPFLGFEDESIEAPLDPLHDKEIREQAIALREIADRYDAPDFRVYLSGEAIFDSHFTEVMARDLRVYAAGCVLICACLLFLLFRRISGVALPLLVVCTSLIATLGIQSLLGIPLSVATQIVPVLIVTVGICDSVHILTIFYQQLAIGRSREEAVLFAMRHSGLAILMTSLTTAAGLMSFVFAEVALVADLGIVAPIGVLIAFAFSVTWLPALLVLLPIPTKYQPARDTGARAISLGLGRLGVWATRRRHAVLTGTSMLLALSAAGMTQLRFYQDSLSWFPEDDPMRVAVETISDELGGLSGLQVWIDSGRANGLHDPDFLRRVERAAKRVEALDDVGVRVVRHASFISALKETHRALNENAAEFYAIPNNRQLVAQELLLFESTGSEDLETWVDNEFRTMRLSLITRFGDVFGFRELIENIEPIIQETLGEDVEFQITGGGALFSKIFSALINSMVGSYLVAFGVITPLMILVVGRLGRGFLAMIPNLIPVVLTLGLMGWLDVALDTSTLLIGGIILGVAVDDTIHFMRTFQRYYRTHGSVERAVEETLQTTGAALFYTTLVLSGGFFVIAFSYMSNVAAFGYLTMFASIVAFFSDLVVAPALLALFVTHE